jgi:hypothetical protein
VAAQPIDENASAAHGHLAAAELAALGLGAEPKLDRVGAGGDDDDAGAGDGRVPGRRQREDCNEWRANPWR